MSLLSWIYIWTNSKPKAYPHKHTYTHANSTHRTHCLSQGYTLTREKDVGTADRSHVADKQHRGFVNLQRLQDKKRKENAHVACVHEKPTVRKWKREGGIINRSNVADKQLRRFLNFQRLRDRKRVTRRLTRAPVVWVWCKVYNIWGMHRHEKSIKSKSVTIASVTLVSPRMSLTLAHAQTIL